MTSSILKSYVWVLSVEKDKLFPIVNSFTFADVIQYLTLTLKVNYDEFLLSDNYLYKVKFQIYDTKFNEVFIELINFNKGRYKTKAVYIWYHNDWKKLYKDGITYIFYR